MKSFIKNTRGMTLIEILAVTVITSIIAILIFSIIQSSVTQQVQQTKEAANLRDITYALKVVTKDIRRSKYANIIDKKLELQFPDDSVVTFFLEGTQLKKEVGNKIEIITDGIGCAEFTADDVISIKLSNTSDCLEVQSTEIHLRKGKGGN